MENNPIGLEGLEFLEYVGPEANHFEELFGRLGLKEVAHQKAVSYTHLTLPTICSV